MGALANCSNTKTDADTMICLCSGSEVGEVILSAWVVSYILLIPVFVYVLYLGYRKQKKHPRSVRHSDIFTFHMVSIELLSVLGSIFLSCGLFVRISVVLITGMSLCCLALTAQLFFHCLTCVERYLAVVHPITYLRFKKRGAVTIRNFSLGFVWLFSGCNSLCMVYSYVLENLIHLLLVILSFALMSFCSVSVLCVLIRPGPGDKNVTKKQLRESKKSSFYTIMAILAVLVLRLMNSMSFHVLYIFQTSSKICIVMASTLWLCLPSSLVLPLLFLHRERGRQEAKK